MPRGSRSSSTQDPTLHPAGLPHGEAGNEGEGGSPAWAQLRDPPCRAQHRASPGHRQPLAEVMGAPRGTRPHGLGVPQERQRGASTQSAPGPRSGSTPRPTRVTPAPKGSPRPPGQAPTGASPDPSLWDTPRAPTGGSKPRAGTKPRHSTSPTQPQGVSALRPPRSRQRAPSPQPPTPPSPKIAPMAAARSLVAPVFG